MKKSSLIIDSVLTFAATYLLGAAIIGYFAANKAATAVSSLTLALAATFFTAKFRTKRCRPAENKKKMKALCDKFVFSTDEYARNFVLNAIKRKHEVRETDGFILSGATAFKVRLTAEKVSYASLAAIYARASAIGAKRLVILSALGADADAADTAKLLASPQTEIWDFGKVYDFLSHLGCPPTETLELKAAKHRFGAALGSSLDKRNARKYLFTAVVTLVFARFMPYPVLYVSIASVCVVLALLSRMEITRRLRRR